MSRTSIEIDAPPDAVFAVLDDACAYPRWVVGARRIRSVDSSWPAVGSSFRHALGAPGAELRDSSTIVERTPPRALELEVRFRPTGVARVSIEVEPRGPGSTVTIEETPTKGWVARLPRMITDPLLTVRNVESLRRLRREVEREAD